MQLHLKVTKTDGQTYQVATNLFTIVALERKFRIRASDLENGVAIEYLAFMAWEASKQANIPVNMVFDEFIRSLEAVEVVDSVGENPTEPAPPATH